MICSLVFCFWKNYGISKVENKNSSIKKQRKREKQKADTLDIGTDINLITTGANINFCNRLVNHPFTKPHIRKQIYSDLSIYLCVLMQKKHKILTQQLQGNNKS